MANKSLRRKYNHKKAQTKLQRQDIEWQFTWETFQAWIGDNADVYANQTDEKICICRYGDTGPYSPENCYIGTAKDNARDASVNGRLKAQKRRCKVNGIEFASLTDAAKHFGVPSGSLFQGVMKRGGASDTKYGYFEVEYGDMVVEQATSRINQE